MTTLSSLHQNERKHIYIQPNEIAENKKNEIDEFIDGKIEMSQQEKAFLLELLIKKNPKKILELGVSRGGSSALILNTIKNTDTKLYSIDFCTNFYKDPSLKTGFILDSLPELKKDWTLYTGAMAYKFMDKIGDGIDFCFIDTAHCNPGELLDFLQVLPYLKEDAIVVFHDTALHTRIKSYAGQIANPAINNTCGLCMSAIYGKKLLQGNFIYLEKFPMFKARFPNIGAIQLNSETREHIFEIFNLLTLHWVYEIEDETLKELSEFFKHYYGEEWSSYFDKICAFQKELSAAKKEQAKKRQAKKVTKPSKPKTIITRKNSLFENIFSIRNEFSKTRHKVVTLLGIKIKFKVGD